MLRGRKAKPAEAAASCFHGVAVQRAALTRAELPPEVKSLAAQAIEARAECEALAASTKVKSFADRKAEIRRTNTRRADQRLADLRWNVSHGVDEAVSDAEQTVVSKVAAECAAVAVTRAKSEEYQVIKAAKMQVANAHMREQKCKWERVAASARMAVEDGMRQLTVRTKTELTIREVLVNSENDLATPTAVKGFRLLSDPATAKKEQPASALQRLVMRKSDLVDAGRRALGMPTKSDLRALSRITDRLTPSINQIRFKHPRAYPVPTRSLFD